ncbi:tellurite resistance protein TehB [Croceibacterium atlanticum]|uniref:Tellurite resistance protein TehB n=2 Tax=Croceibacterium atlanticum TaxID=1267766 RepID=A0A0F7KP23_9SPHN|nr:DUF1971 domain-containing protein [Croceibacterium atlanticum]AKH41334.1 tellurite resistance protein TehB [Croceibacterium atlanticum]
MVRLTPRGDLPPASEAYRTIGPFDAQSLPQGLRAEHSLKPGTWAVLLLSEGSLRFVWDDETGGAEMLTAPVELIVPPQALHHVEGDGPFTVRITFHRDSASADSPG